MEAPQLNYNFESQSDGMLDWLSRIIRNNKYHLTDAVIDPKSTAEEKTNRQRAIEARTVYET